MKTSQEIRYEWQALADGYPGEAVHVRAAFDVLAPYEDRAYVGNRRRWPVYEHPVGPASVDEIWRLATYIADAVKISLKTT